MARVIAHTQGVSVRGNLMFDIPDVAFCGVFGSYAYFVADTTIYFFDLTSSNETYDFQSQYRPRCACTPSPRHLWLGCDGAITIFSTPMDSPSTESIMFPSMTSIVRLTSVHGGLAVAGIDNDGYVTLWDSNTHLVLQTVCVVNIMNPAVLLRSSSNHVVLCTGEELLFYASDLVVNGGGPNSGHVILKPCAHVPITSMTKDTPGVLQVHQDQAWFAANESITVWNVTNGKALKRARMPHKVASIESVGRNVWMLGGNVVSIWEDLKIVSQDVLSGVDQEIPGSLFLATRLEMDVAWHVTLNSKPVCTVLCTERIVECVSPIPQQTNSRRTTGSSSSNEGGDKETNTFSKCDVEVQCSFAVHTDAEVTALLREAHRISAAKDETIAALNKEVEKLERLQKDFVVSQKELVLLTDVQKEMTALLNEYKEKEQRWGEERQRLLLQVDRLQQGRQGSPACTTTTPRGGTKAPSPSLSSRPKSSRAPSNGTSHSGNHSIDNAVSVLHRCVEDLISLCKGVSAVHPDDVMHYVHVMRGAVGHLLLRKT
eukprot:PhF_6_TR40572/c0_g1_i1/m.60838